MGSDQPATNATARMPAAILLASRRQVLALVAGVAVMPLLPRLARAAVLTAGTAETWATGGTKSMTDKATYPDPFAEAPDSCLLVTTTTAGPCTTQSELLREDVSEGSHDAVRTGQKSLDVLPRLPKDFARRFGIKLFE